MLLTNRDAADYLKISERSLQYLRATGGGPAFTRILPGNRGIRYRKEDLDAYVEGCRQLRTGVVTDAAG